MYKLTINDEEYGPFESYGECYNRMIEILAFHYSSDNPELCRKSSWNELVTIVNEITKKQNCTADDIKKIVKRHKYVNFTFWITYWGQRLEVYYDDASCCISRSVFPRSFRVKIKICIERLE